ncbi:hypothetical protein B1H19_19485 [Streptomyces gilvosporeus]|uniref:Uncharacterized protein n=1 Tax=Streptomyces gilvosporeus TaxID=553510 RepID=A0A1V0TT60_9ACTN|nr:hypothetical protein B1H19_19485 [Streptomyces gilvosporeus]
MGCSHAAGCPLFPLLKASLQGWREYYCDSSDRWLGCARYQMSLTGERVPISLLPNGAQARHLEAPADMDRSSATRTTRPDEQSGPGTATPEAMAQFGATPSQAGVRHQQPSPQVARPSDRLAAPRSKRGWWARIAEWMRGPA